MSKMQYDIKMEIQRVEEELISKGEQINNLHNFKIQQKQTEEEYLWTLEDKINNSELF